MHFVLENFNYEIVNQLIIAFSCQSISFNYRSVKTVTVLLNRWHLPTLCNNNKNKTNKTTVNMITLYLCAGVCLHLWGGWYLGGFDKQFET